MIYNDPGYNCFIFTIQSIPCGIGGSKGPIKGLPYRIIFIYDIAGNYPE